MVLQSVTDRVGAVVESLGREVGSLIDVAQRHPGSATLVVAVVLVVFIALALSSR